MNSFVRSSARAALVLSCLAGLLNLMPAALRAGEIIDTDICVYGGTSGGVAAAVQAARMGKTVVLIEPRQHLGGMTSGGLGFTDTGNTAAIGGISREFYRRVGQRYGQAESFTFEPHVAEETFRAMLSEAHAPVYFNHRLASVTMDGQRLREIVTENGDVFRARMFVDTTYEGDLMAAAGVSFTWGRESTATYGESLNGIRGSTPNHQFVLNIDPYVTPGDPNSGLLSYIAAGDGGTPGDGDQRLQSYNYRLCLTQTATNRIAIAAPESYSPTNYELLARYIEARVAAGQSINLRTFLKIDSLPNGKTDINNQGAFSTDFIGMNYTYATNTWAGRDRIWREHEDYIRGLLYFLGTDPRVPASIRTEMNSWGLCKDEFQGSGGWPHQLYVREARRMISDYLMLQQNCQGSRVAMDSVGLASYTMDSHNCQRVLQNGYPRNEGDVQVGVASPYPISYRSIIPRVGECENLFVTFALSASHMGFGSCRMEPVFMITSQSAATAAAIAINDEVPVQQVSYPKLNAQLLADKQLLQWGSSAIDPSGGVIVDSEDTNGVLVVGAWTNSVGAPGYHGAGYLHDGNANKGALSVHLTPNIPTAGVYTVYLRWTDNANRATNVPVTIEYAGGTTNFFIDQRFNGGTWFQLGTFNFDAGTNAGLTLSNAGTTGFVVADAALWLPPSTSLKTVQVFASDPVAGEDSDTATFTFWRSGDVAGDLVVPYTVAGTATRDQDFVGASSSITIPAGQVSAKLQLVPLLDTNIEGDETVTIAISTNAAYAIGALNSATMTIRDEAFDAWRFHHFSAAELEDAAISAEDADPDGDGIGNLAEFLSGSNPLTANVANDLAIERFGTNLSLALMRHRDAATLGLTFESSTDLVNWTNAVMASGEPAISRSAPFETLRYFVTPNSPATFWRVRLAQPHPVPPPTNAAFFFSFDTQTDGNGLYAGDVTANEGFPGLPTFARTGSTLHPSGAGGASFTDFRGTNWIGSGGSNPPGHSSGWNPGSTGNSFSLTFSTIGLQHVQVRFDVRSAAGSGGTPPTQFNSFTYDAGAGAQPVPGANLVFPGDNAFHTWSVDLSSLGMIENKSFVTLTWTFDDLANTPSPIESLRLDNIQVRATGAP